MEIVKCCFEPLPEFMDTVYSKCTDPKCKCLIKMIIMLLIMMNGTNLINNMIIDTIFGETSFLRIFTIIKTIEI